MCVEPSDYRMGMMSYSFKETTVFPYKFKLRQLERTQENLASKTLIIFFGWLYAPNKALEKYFSLYHSRGHDILFIPGLIKHFAWPPCSMELAKQILKYTSENLHEYEYFIVHGTSIGAYNYTSCLLMARQHPEIKYAFFRKLIGIVFDSITFGSTERMTVGVSYGISQNSLLRWMVPKLLSLYFCGFYKTTVGFFQRGVDCFIQQPAEVPSLFFYSRNDPMCDAEKLDEVISMWTRTKSHPIMWKCWESSPHAGHLFKQQTDYIAFHNDFMVLCSAKSKL